MTATAAADEIGAMRIKSAIWVAAYLRRCAAEGIFAVVARRGAESAGAIFIKLVLADGEARLFVPAPQSLAEEDSFARSFVTARDGALMPEAEADRILAREIDFDPDLWVIAVEDRRGRHFLDDSLVAG